MNIHQIAIGIILGWACIYILGCLFFRREAKKLEKRILELQDSVSDYLPVIFSIAWFQDSPRHRTIEARPIIIVLVLWIAPFILMFLFINLWGILGYSMVVALIGALIFFNQEGLQAYSYSRAVRKALPERLQKEDIGWMRSFLDTLKARQFLYIFWTVLFLVIAISGYALLLVFGK